MLRPTEAAPPGSVSIVTLGCSKNSVDTDVIAGMLSRRGVRIEPDASQAEVVIVNTCGFIDHAKQESIQAILEATALKSAGVVREVYVAGCLSERYRSELESELPDVDRFFGTQDFERILDAVTTRRGEPRSNECGTNDSLLSQRVVSTPRHYAYMKISEGCDHPCSFCAIPIMRGGHRSRSIEELEFEAMMLASSGSKELVLIAQDSTNYGLDLYGARSIATLASRLSKVHGIEWIRLMYAYPAQFPLDLLDAMAREEKIVPYLDIPVQHASTSVLKSMRRGITRRATEALISTIRERVPGIALRTTLIVGFPSEGEREFEELEEFVEQMQFDRLGVFTYSQEEGTTADPLGDPVPREVKLERQQRIYDIQAEISYAKNRAKVGTVERVLIDRMESEEELRIADDASSMDELRIADDASSMDERSSMDGVRNYYGRTASHAPEVDGEVRVISRRALELGSFVQTRITGVNDSGADYELEAVAED